MNRIIIFTMALAAFACKPQTKKPAEKDSTTGSIANAEAKQTETKKQPEAAKVTNVSDEVVMKRDIDCGGKRSVFFVWSENAFVPYQVEGQSVCMELVDKERITDNDRHYFIPLKGLDSAVIVAKYFEKKVSKMGDLVRFEFSQPDSVFTTKLKILNTQALYLSTDPIQVEQVDIGNSAVRVNCSETNCTKGFGIEYKNFANFDEMPLLCNLYEDDDDLELITLNHSNVALGMSITDSLTLEDVGLDDEEITLGSGTETREYDLDDCD